MTPEAVRWMLSQALPQPVIHGLGDPEEIGELLAPLGEEAVQAIIAEIPALWPVSQILTLDILTRLPHVLGRIGVEELHDWVKGALERYESGGLVGARRYLDEVEKGAATTGTGGARLGELRKRLGLYLSALAGRPVSVEEGRRARTDGARVFLPDRLSPEQGQEAQALVFKYAATVQWAALRYGTFLLPGPRRFFAGFSDPSLARYLWNLAETSRLEGRIRARLSGLARDMRALRDEARKPATNPAGMLSVRDCLARLSARLPGGTEGVLRDCLRKTGEPGAVLQDTETATRRLFQLFAGNGVETAELPRPFFGLAIGEDEFDAVRLELRKNLKEQYVANLAALLLISRKEAPKGTERSERSPDRTRSSETWETEEAIAQLIEAGRRKGDGEDGSAQARLVTLPNKVNAAAAARLRELEEQIREDLGGIPDEYVAAAQGMAGRSGIPPGMPGRPDGADADFEREDLIYDEWDARRHDYRRNWCRVVELEAAPAGGNFVENTLATHYGTVRTLRRQFELLRRQERFVRRQRDGDDIDLDAAMEAVTDMNAGLSPSERIFVRLQRDERDISTLFLVDMSASTEGWVSTTIKETLVLLCEALDRLGDRYGIFGFSGMRRVRSEWYPIKLFEEPYDDHVKARITGITPRDYTRMGPALRHGTRILRRQESRTRILITLSDGKPEDYDDYKGDYAIEDTRMALIEARAAGIHPFCITVDREAREYLPHMFGERDYVMVHDVRLLPSRVPEIYRAITA